MARRYPDLLAALAWLLIGLAWVWTLPADARLDRDEGFNIMKSALVERGHRLYAEVWSDQPPLFTYLLAGWRAAFGTGDAAARTLVLVMTTLGLMSAGRIATWLAGDARAGLLAVLLLIAARQYVKLSMAVMIGLPAIGLALAGVWLLVSATRWRPVAAAVGFAAAGALAGASMQVKMFTFILLPMTVVAAAWALRETRPRWPAGRIALACGLWLLAFGAATWLFGPFGEPGWKQQLVRTHLRAGLATDDSQLESLRSISSRLFEDASLMLAMVVTLGLAGWRVCWRCLPMGVWFVTSLIVLSQANPLWGHHRVMFSIPAAIATGVAANHLLRRRAEAVVAGDASTAARRDARIAAAALGLAFAHGLVLMGGSALTLGRTAEDRHDPEVLATLRQFAATAGPGDAATKWVLSDDPHVVHAAGLLVPPETAVLSLKRLQRDLTDEVLLDVIARRRPGLIVLIRHAWPAEKVTRLTAGYRMILSKRDGRLRVFRAE